MTKAERENTIHCLKVMIDEEVCEECNLYGMTGTDHCEADCVRTAIKVLEGESCEDCVSRERAKGHWIYDKSVDNWRCSKCGETPKTIGYVGTDTFMAEHFKYCNHCGADMRG